jgi:hypothetical protein
MTTASNREFWSIAVNRAVRHRTWIAILAAVGWLLLTTVALVLAARTWSAPDAPIGDRTVAPEPNSDRAAGVPTLPRAGRESIIDLRAAAALIPRQAAERAS